MKSLQDTYAPNSICFGCGPANDKGLKIKSFKEGDTFIAHFKTEKHHEAFPGMINGGIIGSLLDCHCNWSAAITLMTEKGLDEPPCTVTASYSIQLLRPTPSNIELKLVAKPTEIEGDRVKVEATLIADDKECAKCKGLFVAVKPGHPAYHRWG